jgi:glucokinase
MAVIGLDLGATKLAGALFGGDGSVLARGVELLEGREGDEVGGLIAERLAVLTGEAAARGLEVEAVGVSVPGIARQDDGTVWAPNIPGWERYPLRERLRAELGISRPVVVESDRAASIVAEIAHGVARGCRHAIFLAVGTGIGAGIIVDGRILSGAHDIAGAIGWMGLDRPYRAAYRTRGGFESHASGAGIARVAKELLEAEPPYRGTLRAVAPERLTAHDVFGAFAAGDGLAARVVANAVECWGMAVANLVSLFDPEMIVLGGGLFGPAAGQLDRIVAEARSWAQPVNFSRVAVRTTALPRRAATHPARSSSTSPTSSWTIARMPSTRRSRSRTIRTRSGPSRHWRL